MGLIKIAFLLGPHPLVPRGYFWLCAGVGGSLLAVLGLKARHPAYAQALELSYHTRPLKITFETIRFLLILFAILDHTSSAQD